VRDHSDPLGYADFSGSGRDPTNVN
jgi:hypothetical protein